MFSQRIKYVMASDIKLLLRKPNYYFLLFVLFSHPSQKSVGNRIVSAFYKRIAPKHPPDRKQNSSPNSVFRQSLLRICRTCRHESAARRPVSWLLLIKIYQPEQKLFHLGSPFLRFLYSSASAEALCSRYAISLSICLNSASAMAARATKTTSAFNGSCSMFRKQAFNLRRILLRTTALPHFLLTEKPTRTPSLRGDNLTARSFVAAAKFLRYTREKSRFFLRVSTRTAVYALISFLPLARRRFSTLRPFLVDILLRKPWTLLLFLFLGW